ncbi:SusC/RagA family TonB-linked outer membrane protein [Hymenobacter cellulosivorans]|uniref:SusC/RagA family TonB-linked outer membrane protein n=1 Tax=Hymenobacter cellulosivorans TaxID=2932249 RepID=A0ABY4F2V2_9BACT|nr:SusC/RagA family TonB-linked outer membrane protein [Hymenobacter cellulosivorans]UOQ50992.1 SusC/RagA family TonB-linked outer membrane protein [Hymenobacter cellulosivorans]
MKHTYLAKLLFLLLFVCAGFTSAFAQNGAVSGRVLDEKSQGVPGATVLIEGTTLGSSTNADGTYLIQNVPAGAQTLVTSFVGYNAKRQPVTVTAGQTTNLPDIALAENTTLLSEAVVVGYGTQRRQDVTGSIATISEKQFVQGQVTNPEQLIQGKVAGVQITSGGGAPGASSQIRIRGGSSLNANNDPLIVIDGVPVDNSENKGVSNPLTLVNPNDIETFTVLKDASATAIYGSRASNGVILITTKKGLSGEKLRVTLNSQASVSMKTKTIDVLSADEFRNVVNTYGNASQKALLGNSSTNWQEEIFRTAKTFDNNLSLIGSVGKLPIRASVGNTVQEGILLTNKLVRNTGSISLTPTLLDNHLRIDINAKGSWVDNTFADAAAIGNAARFDPTQSITSGDDSRFGGYFEWLNGDKTLNTNGTKNPVAQLNQKRDRSTAKRAIGNIQFDYKFHFLPELRANLNLGYDMLRSNGSTFVPALAAIEFGNKGANNIYSQKKDNKLLDFYLEYAKQFGESRVTVLGGYSYQDFIRDQPLDSYQASADGTEIRPAFPFKTQYTLVSFFGRLNYNFKDRYSLTATIRRDGSSRFLDGQQFGTFPAIGLAWRIKEEDFLKSSSLFSDLKLRVGYGVTGQQDIESIVGNYPYLGRYTRGENSASYQFGNTFENTLRAEGYNTALKWEETTTYNAGIDYGFLDNRITGTIDVYLRRSDDLLAKIAPAALTNLTNEFAYNIGSLENKGIEFAINTNPVRTNDLNLNLNFNATYNENKITDLGKTLPGFQGYAVGGIGGGVGDNIQNNSVGYPANSFYVLKQVYDANGRPLEGLYADENGDGKSTAADDRYRYKSPAPKVTLGFGSNATYKQFDLAFTLRANLGNYVYNNINSQQAALAGISTNGFLQNLTPDFNNTNFRNYQKFSDYYIENASFLRMDNVTLGYNLRSAADSKPSIRVTAAVQNIFTITKYSGLDPEIRDGIDNNFYPRPRTFTLGLNLGF